MAENDSKEPLLESSSVDKKVDTVVPFLLLVVTGCGMCFSGLGNVTLKFNATSLIYGLFWMALIAVTYWLNAKTIVEACELKGQHSYSKLILSLWGRKRGLTVQILMALNNIIILTYLQQRIAANAFKVFHPPMIEYIEEQTAIDIFYYVAIANIALILLALQNKYERIKNFAILSVLIWIYLFVGVIAEAWNYTKRGGTNIQQGQSRVTFFPEEFAWITTIGITALFTSYFQIVPYVYGNIRDKAVMNGVLKKSFVALLVLITSVGIYFGLYHNVELNLVRYSGLTIIGSCVAIINVWPTRELIVQILDEHARSKSNTRDRIITVLLLSVTLLLSIGVNSFDFMKVFLGIGVLFTSFLGFVFPGWVGLSISEESGKTKAILLLVWNALLGAAVFTAGIFMMLEYDHTPVS